MAKVSRNSGSSRNMNYNSVGQGPKPRTKGHTATTNVGKGTKSGGRSDTTDKTVMKRGDGKGPKAENFNTDSTKAFRSKDRLKGASTDLTYPIQKPLSRGE